jgi:hypothetical protein
MSVMEIADKCRGKTHATLITKPMNAAPVSVSREDSTGMVTGEDGSRVWPDATVHIARPETPLTVPGES